MMDVELPEHRRYWSHLAHHWYMPSDERSQCDIQSGPVVSQWPAKRNRILIGNYDTTR